MPHGLLPENQQAVKGISATDWETDSDGVGSHLESIAGIELAYLAIDLIEHAHRREFDEVHRRLELERGIADVVDESEAADAMESVENSENFVTWEDSSELPPEADWADWMLFLHPEQKEYAIREFSGPARLRGVSGSGKTCVMVHRARRLAKKYRQQILLVTLTESMRRLLDILVRDLCGAEAALIKTSTMNSIALDIVQELGERRATSFTIANRNQIDSIRNEVVKRVRSNPQFDSTVLGRMTPRAFEQFLEDEIAYVRQRFLPDRYEQYITASRHGRGLALSSKARSMILAAVTDWDQMLSDIFLKDHDQIVQTSLELLTASIQSLPKTLNYRCVLVDEVQDLSQLEMSILSLIPDNEGKRVVNLPNGLFLVGDGAQTIYKKGFALSRCGVVIANRSFVLQKNYRNTREILEAAYGLISVYQFADVDEENIATPTEPHLSSRHGEKPLVVKCRNEQDETEFVVKRVSEIINDQKALDEANELEASTDIPIAVIGFSRSDRDRIKKGLRRAKVPVTELRDEVGWESNAVKISTLESAKGHEFHAVFIVGVNQGVIPHYRVPEDDMKREAARLYVAMTRARDRLYMSYDSSSRGGPSILLASIQEDCQECDFSNGRLTVTE